MHNTSGTLVSETIIEKEKAFRRTQTQGHKDTQTDSQTELGTATERYMAGSGCSNKKWQSKAPSAKRRQKANGQKDDNTNWRHLPRTQSLGQHFSFFFSPPFFAFCSAFQDECDLTSTATSTVCHTFTSSSSSNNNRASHTPAAALKPDLVPLSLLLCCSTGARTHHFLSKYEYAKHRASAA